MLNFEWTMHVSFPLSPALSHLTPFPSLLPALSSLWIPTCNERVGSTNPGWRDTATLGIYYLKPVVQRPSLFSRAPRIHARSWLSFFPISPARRHRAVTDDVPPYRDEFFTVDVTLVSPPAESGCARALRKCLIVPSSLPLSPEHER